MQDTNNFQTNSFHLICHYLPPVNYGVLILVTAVLLILGVIIILASPKENSIYSLGNVWETIQKRIRCEHEWLPYYKKMRCNYSNSTSNKECSLENEINWKCVKCEEVRCGIHSDHKPANYGPTPSRNP